MSEIAREHAKKIFMAGVRAVDPVELIQQKLELEGTVLNAGEKSYDLENYNRILVIGGGKAAGPMASAIDSMLADFPVSGLVVTSRGSKLYSGRIRGVEAGHPTPDSSGVDAAREILSLANSADEMTLVICLISGGASALLTSPAKGISLDDLKNLTAGLLACGADIHEINCVRKHLSRIKGGQLAVAVNPAESLTLLISDVPGDPLDVIASGPTVPDPTTFTDAFTVLKKYDLTEQVPNSILNRLEAGAAGQVPETPKPGDPVFAKSHSVLIGTNSDALNAAAKEAALLGYECILSDQPVTGESRETAVRQLLDAMRIKKTFPDIKDSKKVCFLSGGETTVTLKGDGKGGRNQEYILASAIELDGVKGVTVLSAGTDGIDGPTNAAGAIADGSTCETARSKGLDPQEFLHNNDSYTFFGKTGGLIKTGPTNTNVMDLRLILFAGS